MSEHVLIVEDDEAIAYVLRRLLALLGHTAEVAKSVATARAALATGAVDVVFLDLHLGASSALALLDDPTLTLPRTILMSATGRAGTEADGSQLASSYGVPFMPKHLEVEAVRYALARAAVPRRLESP